MTEERKAELKNMAEKVVLEMGLFVEQLISRVTKGMDEEELEAFGTYYLASLGKAMNVASSDSDISPKEVIEVAESLCDTVYNDQT